MHSGFVSVIGRPNVGKSTLLNRVMGEKLTIVSDKPQTTRNRINLIYTDEHMQVIFVDTPGVQRPKNALGEYMLQISTTQLNDMDLILYVVDMSKEIGVLEQLILDTLQSVKVPVVLLINKIDTVPKEEVIQVMDLFHQVRDFAAIIPISAVTGEGVDVMMETIYELLPEGPQYYPADMITDQPEKFIIAEMIREKAMQLLSEEVPHGVFVEVERMKEREGKPLVDIQAVIYVERESHKGIVIGKGGRMLKDIGSLAREDIQRLLGTKVHLELWVKVEPRWRERKAKISQFGYQ